MNVGMPRVRVFFPLPIEGSANVVLVGLFELPNLYRGAIFWQPAR
jgi:hypothetical protein